MTTKLGAAGGDYNAIDSGPNYPGLINISPVHTEFGDKKLAAKFTPIFT